MKTMSIVDVHTSAEHERVLMCVDPSVGYRGMIAVHSTALGPAVGGTRFWRYSTDEEALADLLRLSRGMTYKNAVAGLPFGGGKSIIIGDNRSTNREQLFRTHGRFVESLGGVYITAEDVGTSPEDMKFVRMETRFVAGLAERSGDPSIATAHGVFRALQAAAKYRWGRDTLEGTKVALQGCGHVGYYLARELHDAGVHLVATDIDAAKLARVVKDFNAESVGPEEIYNVKADVFSPCALGGILNDKTVPQFKVEIIAGAANNQLLLPRHGDMIEDRNILYVPDYVANAGGIINGCRELLGWDKAFAHTKVQEIYDTVQAIFAISKTEGIPTYKAADRLAEERLAANQAGAT